ncbi:MAG: IS110 family transposase [Cyclobacteriaceae bacterium]|nr:IS110 family transposase [Cyclobacteriaceae bacterium]
MKYVGVDISKETFDAFNDELGSRQFSNDSVGFAVFKKWIGVSGQVVMEASGPYYLRLAHDLYKANIPVSVINPLVIRRFCQMNLQRAKTDKKDAVSITQFAELTNPSTWSPAPEYLQQLLQMQSVMEQLSKQQTSTLNAMEALTQHPFIDKRAEKALSKVAQIQKAQMTNLEKEIMELTKQHYQNEYASLTSIPGIGKKTAMLLILVTDGFTRFDNIKQLVAYTGIAPRIFQSGKTVNKKPKISKLGMADLRKSLYMCTLRAIEQNEACKNLYERLRQKGKAAKVALIAVCHKLLRQAFAVVKNKNQYRTELSLA